MPPKKVAPASAKTNGPKSAKSRGGAAAKEAKAAAVAAEETKVPEPSAPPLYGVSTDDSHQYHGGDVSPGRGWIQVRAAKLDPVEALRHA